MKSKLGSQRACDIGHSDGGMQRQRSGAVFALDRTRFRVARLGVGHRGRGRGIKPEGIRLKKLRAV